LEDAKGGGQRRLVLVVGHATEGMPRTTQEPFPLEESSGIKEEV
jgi:hypothetical protein